MAGKGLTIPLSLDPREWLRGIKVVERSLEGMEDDLDEVEQAGDKLERALEDNFKDAARAAERAGRDMDDGLQKGMGGASAAGGVLAGEVFDEFIESWGEAVRSGDYGEAIREVFSNLGQIGGAAFGPAGAAGGAVAGLFLTGLYDRITAESQREGELQSAIRDIFLGVTDDAAEAGGGSWVAYRNAVIAAAQTDEAIAEALGVESFSEAIGLIEQKGKELGQTWENDVILALTDAGPAGEQAAKRVEAAWQTSNAEISRLEADLQVARNNGHLDVISNVQQQLDAERARNGELQTGVGWLEDQGVIQDGLLGKASEQFNRDARITTEKQDQAAAARGVADETDRVAEASARWAGSMRDVDAYIRGLSGPLAGLEGSVSRVNGALTVAGSRVAGLTQGGIPV